MGRGKPELKTHLPGPLARGGRVLAEPTFHPKFPSRLQAVPTFLGLLVHLAWLRPSPKAGAAAPGKRYLWVTWKTADNEKLLNPGLWPLAWLETSLCLGAPLSSREASHYPQNGDEARDRGQVETPRGKCRGHEPSDKIKGQAGMGEGSDTAEAGRQKAPSRASTSPCRERPGRPRFQPNSLPSRPSQSKGAGEQSRRKRK